MKSLAASEKLDTAYNAGDAETEAQGGDGEVGAFKPKGREADEKTEESCHQSRSEEGEEKGEMGFRHKNDGAEGAYGKEPGMSQGYLAGVPYQEIEADGHEDVNRYVIGNVNVIILKKEGVEGKEKDEEDEPEKLDARREQLDILVVVPFHVHRRRLRKQSKGWAYLFLSELVNQFLEIDLLFLKKRRPFGRGVQFHDPVIDLLDEFVPFQIIRD